RLTDGPMSSTPHANGQFPRSAHEAAGIYIDHGVFPVPWPAGMKGDKRKWGHLRINRDTLAEHIPPGRQMNVGVMLGEPSRRLADADLDSPEAVSAGPHLLP